MGKVMSIRQFFYIILRFSIIMALSIVIAQPLNRENYDNHYNKALFKIHTTDLNFLSDQLRTRLSYYLIMNDIVALQQVLDSNFGVFGFVITDCPAGKQDCPDQKILYSSNPDLNWRKFPTPADLVKEPYVVLQGAIPLPTERQKPGVRRNTATNQGEIIGRLYILSNMPHSFGEDYSQWIKEPFKDAGPWKYYLKTMQVCLLGGFLIWLVLELSLGIRRLQLWTAKQREYELINNADNYLKLLEEKNYQLEEQNRYTSAQFEIYLNRIKELEQKVKDDYQYKKFAEDVIKEIEEGKQEQSAKLHEELNKSKQEMEILRAKIAEFEGASDKDKKETYNALEYAVKTKFSNAFEQKMFECIYKSPKYLKGEWLLINSFNVAAGKNYSQFTDCIVVSKECLIVIEAKNYLGTIDSDGDIENDKWFCRNEMGKKQIDSLWGDNPFHQVNEYCMSLMHIVKKRSPWDISVYGVIVFQEGSDLSKIGSQIGKFYRITAIDRLVAMLENIEAEARRSHKFGKRPSPLQIENLIRGRTIGNASGNPM
ncbi:MAG: hypothetical protein FD174_3288 [Geobacteraceae bacterium]|nr:MAG: hypothetical protein FD174_3288 [Geobacteraceae bacterium]